MNSAASPPATPEFRQLFDHAIDLRNEGRHAEAVRLFERLRVLNPVSASVHAFLGDTFWELGRLPDAIRSFQKAVELAPRSEMASLGLFHTLLESGQEERANAVMDRFRALVDPDE